MIRRSTSRAQAVLFRRMPELTPIADAPRRRGLATALAAFRTLTRRLETPSETPSFPSQESIEAARRTSLEPTRRQSAARVADARGGGRAPGGRRGGKPLRRTRHGGAGDRRAAWPRRCRPRHPRVRRHDARVDRDRARAFDRRARVGDGGGRTAPPTARGGDEALSTPKTPPRTISRRFSDAEAFAVFGFGGEDVTNTAARLKEVSMATPRTRRGVYARSSRRPRKTRRRRRGSAARCLGLGRFGMTRYDSDRADDVDSERFFF